MDPSIIGKWLGWILLAGYAGLVFIEMLRYFNTAFSAPILPREGAAPVRWPRVLSEVLIAFILSRLLVALTCAGAYYYEMGGLDGAFDAIVGKLLPWDAPHYLGIIDNGYVTVGDPRLHIVFFPFYPMVCRILTFSTGMSAMAAAMLVSNLALIGAGFTMYRLAEFDGGAALGRRAMLLMMFTPMTYFYSIPYTESVFLLTTLLAVLCARKRRFALAVLFGAMSANARVLGMATAIPIFWELLRAEREARRGEAESPAAAIRRTALCALRVLPVAVGLLLYLCINYSLYGNPTQFLIFQEENWHQTMGSIARTFKYSFENAIDYGVFLYRLGVWIPQVLLIVGVPLIVFLRRKHERPGDTAYTLVYHYMAYSPTWLLSGPRYTSADYALYPLLARIPRKTWQFALMLAVECALLCYMSYVGLWRMRAY